MTKAITLEFYSMNSQHIVEEPLCNIYTHEGIYTIEIKKENMTRQRGNTFFKHIILQDCLSPKVDVTKA